MTHFPRMMKKFRKMPTPYIIAAVASRFIFGLGLGELIAGSQQKRWRTVGGITMAVAAAMALPVAMKALRR